ncbi:ankyrin repeat domain-containing protein [Nitrospira sp. Nam74]
MDDQHTTDEAPKPSFISPPLRQLAASPEALKELHRLCREGRLYEVERWITEGKPLQLAVGPLQKSARGKTTLEIAIETGQHSLTHLLLKYGYELAREFRSPLDAALQARRWDLVDLLLDNGADLHSADVYHVELYERCWLSGYDLTNRHEMAAILGHSSSNRPLLGFVKRHRAEDPKIQYEINLALGYQVKEGNERGVNLCLWAGADPHAPATSEPAASDEDGEEDRFRGWSAIEVAAREGHLSILKRLGPDPARDDFDNLYQWAKDGHIITYLATICPPKDLTSILSWHVRWLDDCFPWSSRTGIGTIDALLSCKVRWQETRPEQLADIRRSLLKATDYDFSTVIRRLKREDVCESQTFNELIRTPRIQARVLALGLIKKPVKEREKQREQRARLMRRYDRHVLYERVWSEPVQKVTELYGISDVMLGKVCRALHIPVPPRGYWARIRSGSRVRKPSLPALGSD